MTHENTCECGSQILIPAHITSKESFFSPADELAPFIGTLPARTFWCPVCHTVHLREKTPEGNYEWKRSVWNEERKAWVYLT